MDDNSPVMQPSPAGSPIQDSRTPPTRPKGPNASAVVVGLVAMVLAGLIIAKEVTGLSVNWSRLGPGAIVGIGVLMVLIGAIGLVRRRDNG